MNIKERLEVSQNNKYFVTTEEFEQQLRSAFGIGFNSELFQSILDKFLIITLNEHTKDKKSNEMTRYVAREDVHIACRLFELNKNISRREMDDFDYQGSFFVERIKIASGTFLIYDLSRLQKKMPVFVRNILYYMTEDDGKRCEPAQFDFLGVTILTTNFTVRSYIENAIYRKYQLDQIKTSSFANSSSYMGSKKRIVGFIIESIFPHVSDSSVFLDIMCGSGAVSNALAQMGDVFASDAQYFCRLLAKIQGKGFTEKKARDIIKVMYRDYNINLKALKQELSAQLDWEEAIFHMDLNHEKDVLAEYEKFVNAFELYSTTGDTSNALLDKINPRKEQYEMAPYCLFTYYYANVYFGLAQCVQLDSIRYAVDQIEDSTVREWVLGVLVVVASTIATTHAGHFAQPKRLDIKSLKEILEQRGKSAWLEFSKRIISISADSERYQHPVHILEGPWENALKEAGAFAGENLVVYLDAPYKREEYSRYYHILETIVKYDYPSSENKGRMRSKTKGERFSTEFFTKTVSKVEDYFEFIITEILKTGNVCAWSYSDNGMASIKNVVTRIKERIGCTVYIYGMPYVHTSQRQRKERGTTKIKVVEYCIVFVTNK